MNEMTQPTDTDVLIIGAGISGISAAYHLKKHRPNNSFIILEGRNTIGGTWTLFRYPGVRSDSDMPSFGFGFKPWTDEKSLADARDICSYLQDTIEENGIDEHIRLGYKVIKAAFSSKNGRWTITAENVETKTLFTFNARFLLLNTGYYDYKHAYTPKFEGSENFKGQIIHPQYWPEDLDYADKRVVVIGSGATAVTLIPSMAATAKHVTMLQRSPTYILSVPAIDSTASLLNKLLGYKRAYPIIRKKNILFNLVIYKACRRFPKTMRKLLIAGVRRRLPKDFDVDTHFTPRYNPWDERLCLVPDDDMFKAISAGQASVVTDHIKQFTEDGILLESGETLDADIIVTATGLNMLAFSQIELSVDDRPIHYPDTTMFKSMMLSDVPNLAFALGYTNNSWTLKVDLVWEHFCRILDHMDKLGYSKFEPIIRKKNMKRAPLTDLNPGYMQRGLAQFPKAGTEGPWTSQHAYEYDLKRLRHGPVADDELIFSTITP
ncbi:putative monooxygenase [Xenorhabdus mauleonii]|uniref:Monooxygenase n=1 Tax=Xenorhabdus mauleonii TaxID=351675 RepID=A0A1I3LZW7_9GAMM|nr:NAD(P)/FAD-dependent oxidoreductase [Xenorhabdus mauleonii]PHM45358.1 putative monooxygenase [Xenorhabdus mauleonii]SFI90351.1 Predicted flavoprotein CzcO associated with the cation diffusion facilitator CzcD [Xenorhabdus mauleonii]